MLRTGYTPQLERQLQQHVPRTWCADVRGVLVGGRGVLVGGMKFWNILNTGALVPKK